MVHCYKNNGFNIVLDVNSGAVHVVDDMVYDLIPALEECIVGGADENAVCEKAFSLNLPYSQEEIKEAVSEILELKEAEMLYSVDIYEPYIDSIKNREFSCENCKEEHKQLLGWLKELRNLKEKKNKD